MGSTAQLKFENSPTQNPQLMVEVAPSVDHWTHCLMRGGVWRVNGRSLESLHLRVSPRSLCTPSSRSQNSTHTNIPTCSCSLHLPDCALQASSSQACSLIPSEDCSIQSRATLTNISFSPVMVTQYNWTSSDVSMKYPHHPWQAWCTTATLEHAHLEGGALMPALVVSDVHSFPRAP